MSATTFTIAPPSAAARARWNARHAFHVPVRFVSTTARQPFSEISSAHATN